MNPWIEATEDQIQTLIGGPGGVQDMLDAFSRLSVYPDGRVIEIGCGVGRLAQLFESYIGYDVSPVFVEAARANGIDARLVPVEEKGDWLLLAYVFCHLPYQARMDYLRQDIAPRMIVTILPGDGSVIGDPLIYTQIPDEFEQELASADWGIKDGPYRSSLADPNHDHLYYYCER